MTDTERDELEGASVESSAALESAVASDLQALRQQAPIDFNDARKRFLRWRRKDPFPHIKPALLNCSAFCDYVNATGMIFPFHFDRVDLKLAAYDMRLLGDTVYWDARRNKHEGTITQDELFTLEANSIAFVTLEPYLQLPDYIALRFNLRITNVYRGLLLGTGPIVDPGYQGKLSIPLHNLTTNPYTFRGGEPLITVEFTKLAPHQEWATAKLEDPSLSHGLYVPFPEPNSPDPEKTERRVAYFLYKADPQRAIQSSILPTLEMTTEAAKSAQAAADRAGRTASIVAWVTIIAVLLSLVAVAGAVYDSYSVTHEVQNQLTDRLATEEASTTTMDKELKSLRDSLSAVLNRLPRK